MEISTTALLATICFFGALLHSLSATAIERFSQRFRHRTVFFTFLHFAAEIEIIFALWAGLYVVSLALTLGFQPSLEWLDQRNFSEAVFVFAIMTMAATRPIIEMAETIVNRLAHCVPTARTQASYWITLVVTPILGSFITEPAAMTVAALLLKKQIFDRTTNQRLLYSTIATLFVNVSIGGTLTSFAAPPVLMVARVWSWDSLHMLQNFGWKAAIAVVINASIALFLNSKELKKIAGHDFTKLSFKPPVSPWIKMIHIAFVAITILTLHHPAFVFGLFIFFIGFTQATSFAQTPLKIKESLLVAFFLAGLVVLTAEQGWWLTPLLAQLQDFTLFAGATGLTAITDNAALTSLAAQVSNITDASKYAVVAGAVAGGGLTLIANAPNPAGYAILRDHFKDGIRPGLLFAYALLPTLIAGVFLWMM
jgi:hypothetical protein